jgi:hypothetical protein
VKIEARDLALDGFFSAPREATSWATPDNIYCRSDAESMLTP